MTIVLIVIAVILLIVICLPILARILYKRDLKKDKYDLLHYLIKHHETISITMNENNIETLAINKQQPYPLASTLKLVIAYQFVEAITAKKFLLTDTIKMSELDILYIPNTDGGAHPNWKQSIGDKEEVTFLEVAQGMMQFSSNVCTDFLLEKIGIDIINKRLQELQMNHDPITYLTPSTLLPGYLANRPKEAVRQLNSIDELTYEKLSCTLLEKMKENEVGILVETAPNMINRNVQKAITNKLPYSTTEQYVDFLLRLEKELLTNEQKALFSQIVLGEQMKKSQDYYVWFKGGATLYVATGALLKKSKQESIAVSLFIKDDSGLDMYWISRVYNDFIQSVAFDPAFRNAVKERFECISG